MSQLRNSMGVQPKLLKGTAADNDAYTGYDGELTIDTTNNTLRVHDGVTPGGSRLATEDTVQ